MPASFAVHAVSIMAALALAAGCRPAGKSGPPSSHEAQTNPSGLAPIADVLARHAPSLMALDGVTAVGEGRTGDGRTCVRVFVVRLDDALRAKIPPQLEGYPVLVEESGPIRAMDDTTGKDSAK